MSLLLCLNPKTKSTSKKRKEKGPEQILDLTAPITKYVPASARTEVAYHCAPRHDSLSPTDSGDYNRSQQSNDSGQSYQSKSSGYASGYMTDDSMSSEGQLLRRATQTNPASVIMTVIKDYQACCGEEMSVKKGQHVKVMYRQGDWAYAVSKHGSKGFIPYSFIRVSRKYTGSGYASEPEGPSRRHLSGYETDPGISRTRHRLDSSSTITSATYRSMSRKDIRYTSPIARNCIREETPAGYMSECAYSTPITVHRQGRSVRPSPTTYFRRNFIEELVVLHDFTATDEDEVMVSKGERVRVLNADDSSWLWVQTAQGQEGYVPRNCLSFGTHPALQHMSAPPSARLPIRRVDRLPRQQQAHRLRSQSASRAQREYAKQQFRQLALAQHNPAKVAVCQTKEEIKRIGTRLLVLSNYEPLQSDELRVELGEMVLADVLTQSNVKRVWAYYPQSDQVGYLPVWVVHPPIL